LPRSLSMPSIEAWWSWLRSNTMLGCQFCRAESDEFPVPNVKLAEDDDGRFPERQNATGVRCPTSFAVTGIVLRTAFIGLLMVLI
jgi:hypothetical protein